MWSVATTSRHLSPVGHRGSPCLVPDGERLILRLEVDGDDRRAIVEICGDQLDVDCGNHMVSMVLPPDVGPDDVEATLYGTSLEISLPWSHGLLPTVHEMEHAANAAKLELRGSLRDACVTPLDPEGLFAFDGHTRRAGRCTSSPAGPSAAT